MSCYIFFHHICNNAFNLTGDRDGTRVGGSDGLGVLPGVGLLVGLRVRIFVGFWLGLPVLLGRWVGFEVGLLWELRVTRNTRSGWDIIAFPKYYFLGRYWIVSRARPISGFWCGSPRWLHRRFLTGSLRGALSWTGRCRDCLRRVCGYQGFFSRLWILLGGENGEKIIIQVCSK